MLSQNIHRNRQWRCSLQIDGRLDGDRHQSNQEVEIRLWRGVGDDQPRFVSSKDSVSTVKTHEVGNRIVVIIQFEAQTDLS